MNRPSRITVGSSSTNASQRSSSSSRCTPRLRGLSNVLIASTAIEPSCGLHAFADRCCGSHLLSFGRHRPS